MDMYKSGSMVAIAVYNATGSDKVSWLKTERLRYSSWIDAQDGNVPDASQFGVTGFRVDRLVV